VAAGSTQVHVSTDVVSGNIILADKTAEVPKQPPARAAGLEPANHDAPEAPKCQYNPPMPGLAAVVAAPDVSLQPTFDVMLRRMSHYDWFRSAGGARQAEGVALGAVRLENGPDPGPALSEDGRFTLWIDGELYDADAARADLAAAGVDSSRPGDAALLLAGWRHEGARFLGRLHGIFNAIVWDQDERTLVVITDRFGLRPIYVSQPDGAFVVASEIKAVFAWPGVDRSWSEAGFAQFFAFGHFFGDETLHSGVRALPPATVLSYRAGDGQVEERRYWEWSLRAGRATDAALADELERTLVEAVRRRTRPGERLGLSLSGGLDARTLLGLMPAGLNLQTVCIGVEGSIDHRGSAELARLAGVPHHAYILDEHFLASFERHLRSMVVLTDGHYLDQGIVMTTLPTYRELEIDFLLRGHGGELLHMSKAYSFSLDDAALRASEAEIGYWLFSHLSAYMLAGVPPEIFAIDVRGLAQASLARALERTGGGSAPVDRASRLFLNARLHRETSLSMHKFGCFSTVRMPFIDNDVVGTIFAMPTRMRLDEALQTEVLRRRRPAFVNVVNSNTGAKLGASKLRRELAHFRMRVLAKLGVKGYKHYEQLGLWLRHDLRPLVERVVLGDRFLAGGLFKADVVKRVIEEHAEKRANHTFLLMSLLIFGLGQEMLDDPEGFGRGVG